MHFYCDKMNNFLWICFSAYFYNGNSNKNKFYYIMLLGFLEVFAILFLHQHCRSFFMKKSMKRVLIMRARRQLKIIANKERSRIYEIICLMHLCIIVRRRRAKWKCKERYRSRLLPCIHIVDIWKCAYYKKVERHLIF